MPEGQRHLTHTGRSRIHATGKSGLSDGAIARQLGRDRTTVWREVRRNPGERACRHAQAQRRSEARRRAAPSVPSRMTPERWSMVEERLAEGWSPEQVSGRLRKEGHPVAGRQWIYRHVHADRRAGGGLWRHLRRRGERPNRKGGAHAGRGHIPGRVDIPERPAPGEAKARVGAAMTRMLGSLPVHTVTADNGKEFADHARVAGALGARFFFARPYHSWEWGPTGHTNGLVRGYLPKGTDLRRVTDAEVRAVQDRTDARPRRVLGYLTPAEAFLRSGAGEGKALRPHHLARGKKRKWLGFRFQLRYWTRERSDRCDRSL